MWQSRQLLVKTTVLNTGVRHPGNTLVAELVAVIGLNNYSSENGVKKAELINLFIRANICGSPHLKTS